MIKKYILGEISFDELIDSINNKIQNIIEKEMKKRYFKKRNGEFYTELTKTEILNNININDLNTVLPYLKILDYPYFKRIWTLTIEHSDNKYYVFGKYIARMRLKGFINFGYNDSDHIRKEGFEYDINH